MKIYVVGLEKIPTRYSEAWYTHIPELLRAAGAEVVVIDGEEIPPTTTPGAFLDFAATNAFKSSQLIKISKLFSTGEIQPGDKFLYTDAWNPTVTQLKYMSKLFQIPVTIQGLWHAGSYDPADFLGRLIGDKPWVRNLEASMFYCYDVNWFATRFHSNMFCRELLGIDVMFEEDETAEMQQHNPTHIQLTGWPMDYMNETLQPYRNLAKKNQIVFPHRIAPEKQLEIFKDLEQELPEYNWIVCQEKTLSKHEYHTILGESKICFSASLQESLGISTVQESPLTNAIPLVPNRLSYKEIFEGYSDFLYPSEWTQDFQHYIENKSNIINKIKLTMENYDNLLPTLHSFVSDRIPQYFTAEPLIKSLLK